MRVSIEREVLEKYPETQISYLVADVSIQKSDPFVEKLKESLKGHLESQGISPTTFALHPSISLWREIYERDFHVRAKTYRSSLEALLKRVITGKEIWHINSVVDLYNCSSILSLLPMGGYDLQKISGEIQIRYAKEKEPFLALGERTSIEASSHHVVYADDDRLLCWLWNHKDSALTSIDESSERVIFFIDSFDHNNVKIALGNLEHNLKKIGCFPLEWGILNNESPQIQVGSYVFDTIKRL